MKVGMSGTIDGVSWPPQGGEIDVPDPVGAKFCAAGMAEPVAAKDDDVEKAVMPEPEKRGPGRPRKPVDKG